MLRLPEGRILLIHANNSSHRLLGSNSFTTQELSFALWHVEVAEPDRKKSTSIVSNRLYHSRQYLSKSVTSQGLFNTWCRQRKLAFLTMRNSLRWWYFIGKDICERNVNLEQMGHCLQDAELIQNPIKRCFTRWLVIVLGYIIPSEGWWSQKTVVNKWEPRQHQLVGRNCSVSSVWQITADAMVKAMLSLLVILHKLTENQAVNSFA